MIDFEKDLFHQTYKVGEQSKVGKYLMNSVAYGSLQDLQISEDTILIDTVETKSPNYTYSKIALSNSGATVLAIGWNPGTNRGEEDSAVWSKVASERAKKDKTLRNEVRKIANKDKYTKKEVSEAYKKFESLDPTRRNLIKLISNTFDEKIKELIMIDLISCRTARMNGQYILGDDATPLKEKFTRLIGAENQDFLADWLEKATYVIPCWGRSLSAASKKEKSAPVEEKLKPRLIEYLYGADKEKGIRDLLAENLEGKNVYTIRNRLSEKNPPLHPIHPGANNDEKLVSNDGFDLNDIYFFKPSKRRRTNKK
ncbi:hypothetical protein [Limosilactobacillus sp.]|uniref:hypothetical protein n=1 Tax=Limosilactobacillus sp. TaxID=2773925 RepID=UPI003EFE302C